MFNSIPVDAIDVPKPDKNRKKSTSELGLEENQTIDRIKVLLKYLRKYGVPEQYLFEINELKDMTNIPKVTRCIAMLGKMVILKFCTI